MRSLCLLLSLLLLPTGAWAQGRTEASAFSQAAQVTAEAANGRLPTNIVYRLRILDDAGQRYASGADDDINSLLRFFSQTRRLYWSDPNAGAAAAQMTQFEQRAVALAATRGINLDLPPVGASQVGSQLAPPEPSYDRATLVNATRQAETLSQDLWAAIRNRPLQPGGVDNEARRALLGLAESTRGLRMAQEQGGTSAAHFDALLASRAVYLMQRRWLTDDPGLRQKSEQLVNELNMVVAAHRTLYPR